MRSLYYKKIDNYKIDELEAYEEIAKIEEEFGELDEAKKTVFVDSIRRGQLACNGDVISFKLAKPIEDIELINFPMLTADQLLDLSDLEVINLNGKTNEMQVKLKKQQLQKTYRMLNKICKIDVTKYSKMKKVDMDVCMVITDFLS
jgi:hypothetical protein